MRFSHHPSVSERAGEVRMISWKQLFRLGLGVAVGLSVIEELTQSEEQRRWGCKASEAALSNTTPTPLPIGTR